MPKFNLAPLPDDLNPVWSPPGQRAEQNMADYRAKTAADAEKAAGSVPVIGGVLKPLTQFMNTLASPDTKMGIFTGPVNGVSKLGNAIGDLVQGKQIDVKDAWTISDKAARQFNPWRIGAMGQGVTPSDEAGLAVGEGIGAEMVGFATGTALVRRAGQLAQLKRLADAAKATRAVKGIAVAAKTNGKVRAGLNASRNVGEALVSTTLAAPFLDQEDGNLANAIADLTGLKLPGRVDEGDNYFQALGKGILVEGIAAPLALIGAGSFIAPVRKGLASGDLGWLDQLAEAELAPYTYKPPTAPGLQLPPGQQGGAIVPAQPGGAMVPAQQVAAPIRLYRGTKTATAGARTVGDAFFMTPDRKVAEAYAGAGGSVTERMVTFTNLLDTSDWMSAKNMLGLPKAASMDELVQAARKAGHDGLSFSTTNGKEYIYIPKATPLSTQAEATLNTPDSAISRALQEQTQIRQVIDQRQRLQDMGLLSRGQEGQLELSLGGAVDPEIRLQIRQLQVQRGQLIKQGIDAGEDLGPQIGAVDQQIADLIQAGRGQDFMPGERFSQPELDLVDPRPELDTYLANLDELSDAQLRQIHSRVYRQENEARVAQELTQAQAKVDGISERLADIQARADAGSLTPTGAKRLLSKAQKELAAAQQEVQTIQGRTRVPESLVGDQLEMQLPQQLGLDLADEIALPPLREMTATGSEYGYRTPDDYRSALQGWPRDLLRRLAMPDSSPEIAALVKARTGRRVWQAKKSDIIDALVEMSVRRGNYLPPEPPVMEQGALRLVTNAVGDNAPLLDQPADLNVPGMVKTLDADGNEIVVPMVDYSGRGMDAATRERLKAEVLQRAIDNGEVQPPITPVPARPTTSFNQGSLVDDLFADPTGQLPLLYATDQVPTYKASGKNADALVEEMRLRLEFNELDAAARQAQREAYLAEQGWNKLSWEEKKRLGILSEGFYSLQPFSDRFQAPTTQFDPDLQIQKPRKPLQYRLKNGQLVQEDGPKAKPSPEQAKVQQQQAAAAAAETKAAAKAQTAALDKQEAAIKKRLDELLRQSQGANC